MDLRWPDELLDLSRQVAAVAAAATSEIREDGWVVGRSREFSLELGRRGWLGMTWPTSLGGHGRPAIDRFVVTEGLIAGGAPIALTWTADRQIGPALIAHGTADQQHEHLPDIVAGRSTWAIGMSEPDAGSDVASLTTRAELRGDRWVVNGRKIWTTFAAEADWCYLFARTEVDQPVHDSLSELIVDLRSPGIEARTIKDMTGGSEFCEVTFDDVEVPVEHLVGRRGGAFRQMMRQLEHERGGLDRLLSNRGLFLDACDVVDHSDPRVRNEIAWLESRYRIGRLLLLRSVLGEVPSGWSALTKVFGTELEQRVANFASRAFGATTMLSGRAARAACYAPAYTIQGGTSTILRDVMSERLLRLPRSR